MLSIIKKHISNLWSQEQIHQIKLTLGRIENRQLQSLSSSNIQDYEFSVYSQWGEDGIIQYLLRKIPVANKVFIEFGVENYRESNTRFLLQNNNWSGLVMDGSAKNIHQIKQDPISWRYNLKSACIFISAENVNQSFSENGMSGDIGLLSIDIDGNDYWVWKAVSVVKPCIIICEYNSLFGCKRKVCVPYDKEFRRTGSHYSNLYYGASIAALEYLGRKKGYTLIGSNTAGNNCFFIRNDLVDGLMALSPEQAYVRSKFCEARDRSGKLTPIDPKDSIKLIADLSLIDVDKQETIKVGDLEQP